MNSDAAWGSMDEKLRKLVASMVLGQALPGLVRAAQEDDRLYCMWWPLLSDEQKEAARRLEGKGWGIGEAAHYIANLDVGPILNLSAIDLGSLVAPVEGLGLSHNERARRRSEQDVKSKRRPGKHKWGGPGQ